MNDFFYIKNPLSGKKNGVQKGAFGKEKHRATPRLQQALSRPCLALVSDKANGLQQPFQYPFDLKKKTVFSRLLKIAGAASKSIHAFGHRPRFLLS